MEKLTVSYLRNKIAAQKANVEKCKADGLDQECITTAELVLQSLEDSLRNLTINYRQCAFDHMAENIEELNCLMSKIPDLKDITREQLINNMKLFSGMTAVICQQCYDLAEEIENNDEEEPDEDDYREPSCDWHELD